MDILTLNFCYSIEKIEGIAELGGVHILIRKEVINLGRLVINGEEIYELDERCLKEKKLKQDKDKRYRMWEEQKQTKTNWRKESKL